MALQIAQVLVHQAHRLIRVSLGDAIHDALVLVVLTSGVARRLVHRHDQ